MVMQIVSDMDRDLAQYRAYVLRWLQGIREG